MRRERSLLAQDLCRRQMEGCQDRRPDRRSCRAAVPGMNRSALEAGFRWSILPSVDDAECWCSSCLLASSDVDLSELWTSSRARTREVYSGQIGAAGRYCLRLLRKSSVNPDPTSSHVPGSGAGLTALKVWPRFAISVLSQPLAYLAGLSRPASTLAVKLWPFISASISPWRRSFTSVSVKVRIGPSGCCT